MRNHVKSTLLNRLPTIKHGFFNKTGGCSGGIYSSLNCGTYSHDAPENVLKNRNIALKTLSNDAKLIEIHQTHSNHVHLYNGEDHVAQADAIITDQPNIALSVVTADCSPILMVDQEAHIIAAVHAGWKGAKSGIIENAIDKMCSLGANVTNIHASIGPSIAQCSYEVGPEFYSEINNETYFIKSPNEDHYLFDLEKYVHDRLSANGIVNIDPLGIDTYHKTNDFFSYRRKTHLEENDYGRQISIILQN